MRLRVLDGPAKGRVLNGKITNETFMYEPKAVIKGTKNWNTYWFEVGKYTIYKYLKRKHEDEALSGTFLDIEGDFFKVEQVTNELDKNILDKIDFKIAEVCSIATKGVEILMNQQRSRRMEITPEGKTENNVVISFDGKEVILKSLFIEYIELETDSGSYENGYWRLSDNGDKTKEFKSNKLSHKDKIFKTYDNLYSFFFRK